MQLAGIQQAAAFQNVSTLLKVALILLFIVAGFAVGEPQPISFAPSAADFGYITSAPFFISLFYVMYSYAGWNAATYIAGEIRDPRRDLPLSMLIAVATVTLLYVALNAVFLYTTPIAKLAGQIDVGLIAGKQIFGDAGGRIVGALICIGLVSAVSAMMWIGPRVTMAMGEDLPLLSAFARKTRERRAGVRHPAPAAVATLMLLTQTLRVGGEVHAVQPDLLLVSGRARRHRAALHQAGPAAPLPRVGLSADAAPFSRHVALHDDLSAARAAAGGAHRAWRSC